jgi:murein DD-endopeptidase MepM/ murein hydrolase activator NlpD
MVKRSVLIRLLISIACILSAVAIGLYDHVAEQMRPKPPAVAICQDDDSDTEDCIPKGPIDETLEIKRGDTLFSVLERAGIASEQATNVIEALNAVFNPRELRPDHELYITYTAPEDDLLKKDLSKLYLKLAIDLEIIVERDDAGQFIAQKVQKELVHEHRAVEGKIQVSLSADATKAGVPPKILHDMISSFLHDVDFQRDFQQGDDFGLLYDTYKEPESLQEKPGNLLFAYLKLQGRVLKIYFFKPKNGVGQYFTEKGDSVKKGLMRTPIDGARITSAFGNRHHPILGYTRMHKGVDFGAPIGTPIMAAGDGVIRKIGRHGSYGNYILIVHCDPYSTAYAHLSKFARGLKLGCKVRQGQIIGYVGRTGRCTGPHLHYEVLKAGQINPKIIKTLPTGKLRGKELQTFMALKNKIDQQYVAQLEQPKESPEKALEDAGEEEKSMSVSPQPTPSQE